VIGISGTLLEPCRSITRQNCQRPCGLFKGSVRDSRDPAMGLAAANKSRCSELGIRLSSEELRSGIGLATAPVCERCPILCQQLKG
jgi:hypothetical protein